MAAVSTITVGRGLARMLWRPLLLRSPVSSLIWAVSRLLSPSLFGYCCCWRRWCHCRSRCCPNCWWWRFVVVVVVVSLRCRGRCPCLCARFHAPVPLRRSSWKRSASRCSVCLCVCVFCSSADRQGPSNMWHLILQAQAALTPLAISRAHQLLPRSKP